MRYLNRLRIREKGLLLVALPLLFELVFAFSLSVLLFQADEEIKQEWQSRLISSKLARLQMQIYNCATNAAGVFLNGDKKFKKMYESSIIEINKCLIDLFELTGADKTRARYLEPVLRSSDKAMVQCGLLCLPKESSSELERLLGSRESLIRLMRVVNEVVNSQTGFLAHERAIEADAPVLRKERRMLIQALLMTGVASSIILCVVLSMYFGADIGSRLAVIALNIERFRDKRKLLRPVGGNDEISSLDAGFHLMAERLCEDLAFKRQMLALLSHELRTPLTSVSASLSVIESGALGELSEPLSRCVREIQNDIDNVMSLSTKLLQIEKMEAGKLQLNMQVIDMSSVFEELQAQLNFLSSSRAVSLRMPETDGNFSLKADYRLLIEVLQEVLANALAASLAGTQVQVVLEDKSENYIIHVIDEGTGIPEYVLKAEFDSLAPDESGSGLGLGLPFCKAVMDAHAGRLVLRRLSPSGSQVSLCFPKLAER